MAPFKSTRAKAPPPAKQPGDVDAALRAVTSVLNSHDDEIQKLNGGLTLGQNTVGIVKKISFAMPADAPFVSVTPTADWVLNAPPLQYLMEPGGRVWLRGGVATNPAGIYAGPGGAPAGTTICTLPAGYRPSGILVPPAICNLVAAAGLSWLVGSVTTAGVVIATKAAANFSACFFDGVSWIATAAAPPHQFSGGAWPLRIQHGFDSPCTGLVVLGYRLSGQTGQNVGAGTPMVDWQDLGDGSLRINGVWGLQWGQSYDLRLYLTPEKEEE